MVMMADGRLLDVAAERRWLDLAQAEMGCA